MSFEVVSLGSSPGVLAKSFNGVLCNGSTKDSESFSLGSIPSTLTRMLSVIVLRSIKIKKLEKQQVKLKEKIEQLEAELKTSLQKKSFGKSIDVPLYTRKIQELKKELAELN